MVREASVGVDGSSYLFSQQLQYPDRHPQLASQAIHIYDTPVYLYAPGKSCLTESVNVEFKSRSVGLVDHEVDEDRPLSASPASSVSRLCISLE